MKCCWCSWVVLITWLGVSVRERAGATVPLWDARAEAFGSAVMRLGPWAQDRGDVQDAVKEAARGMGKLLVGPQGTLRLRVRFWIRAPTLTCRWYTHRWPGRIGGVR